MLLPINWLAVIGAAVASFVAGWVWYGPLFGRVWMRLRGMDGSAMQGPMPYDKFALQFFATLITSYFLAQFMGWVLVLGVAGGMVLAFWIWLAFIATLMLERVLWEKESWSLYAFNISQKLVSLLIMAAILATWR